MNLAEKLAAAYLRLSGFLLLPSFTVFAGKHHNHIDLIGFRAPNSRERVDDHVFLIDEQLFDALSKLRGENAASSLTGIAAEVRSNEDKDSMSNSHIEYVREFLGGVPVSRLTFFEGDHAIIINNDTLEIGLRYAGIWIQRRIEWMLELNLNLTKTGSWNWSESFLSDYLSMYHLRLLTEKRG